MGKRNKTYEMSWAYIVARIVFWEWFVIVCTCGVLLWLEARHRKNTTLSFENKFLVYRTGWLAFESQEIPFEDILSIKCVNPLIGQLFGYSHLTVKMKDRSNDITIKGFKTLDVKRIRDTVQEEYREGQKIKMF